MPERYRLGLTDLVARCTARADQVSSLEFQAGSAGLLAKIVRYKPIMVCFVGMDVFRNFRKHFPKHLTGTTATIQAKGEVLGSPQMAQSPPVKMRVRDESTQDTSSPLAGSGSKGKGKQSTSDVQLGLQSFCLGVSTNSDAEQAGLPGEKHLVRLFAIPSTSGLAAGYSDADRVEYLREAKETVQNIRAGAFDGSWQSVIDAEEYLGA